MRHTLQRIIPLRLQYGTVGHMDARPNGRLAHTVDTIGGPETRLTRETLDTLRETGRLTLSDAAIARLCDTRKGRRTLRAMVHEWQTRGRVYGLDQT